VQHRQSKVYYMLKTLKFFFLHKINPYLIAYCGKFILRAIVVTCKFKAEGVSQFRKEAKKGKSILMLWHNRLPLVAEILNKYAPDFTYAGFISNSRDGESMAILTNSYKGGRTIRVPHDTRAHALNRMISRLKYSQEIIVITPDGPRGPRYKIKPGMALAAKEASAKIIPLSWSSSKFWQINSWDKMIFPKPFSTIHFSFGEPIDLENKALSEDEETELLQNTFLEHDKKICSSITQDQNLWPK
jgi:lysophospholipid acyltransferase (LPLAT)-like uncharacterized protein